jgi:hypothetical protein
MLRLSFPNDCPSVSGKPVLLMVVDTRWYANVCNRQKLLMQFLSVLSVIEGMYTFGRDISAE